MYCSLEMKLGMDFYRFPIRRFGKKITAESCSIS